MLSTPSALSTPAAEPQGRVVPYVDLAAQFREERAELMPLVEAALAGGHYVGGPAIEDFERAVARHCEVDHAVALNSGTDALVLALRALGIGPGDEVITPPNSFIASAAAIVQCGATPVFADVRADQNIDPARIEAAVTGKTKAIMPVHLTGRICDMAPILEIAQRHGLAVVEDAAQSIGSRHDGRPSGSLGRAGCFSTHPLKNLNACGDGGFLTTDDAALAAEVRLLRNHGLEDRDKAVRFGQVSRMDALQAVILGFRLARLDSVIARRRENARLYRELLDPELVFMPPCRPIEFNSFHTFVVQVERRDALRDHLAGRGIGTAIHYPRPIHLQPAAAELGHGPGDFPVAERQAGRILSLPINQSLGAADIAYVAEAINRFVRA